MKQAKKDTKISPLPRQISREGMTATSVVKRVPLLGRQLDAQTLVLYGLRPLHIGPPLPFFLI